MVSRGEEDGDAHTHTAESTSNSTAPSERSEMLVTGLESSKLAKKWKKASISFCSSRGAMKAGYKARPENGDRNEDERVATASVT